MGESEGRRGFEEDMRNLGLDGFLLECILDIHAKMQSRWLDVTCRVQRTGRR